jgi:hypothetical protein
MIRRQRSSFSTSALLSTSARPPCRQDGVLQRVASFGESTLHFIGKCGFFSARRAAGGERSLLRDALNRQRAPLRQARALDRNEDSSSMRRRVSSASDL